MKVSNVGTTTDKDQHTIRAIRLKFLNDRPRLGDPQDARIVPKEHEVINVKLIHYSEFYPLEFRGREKHPRNYLRDT